MPLLGWHQDAVLAFPGFLKQLGRHDFEIVAAGFGLVCQEVVEQRAGELIPLLADADRVFDFQIGESQTGQIAAGLRENVVARLSEAIARYAGPKGNQFPLDQPIPYDLIERNVKLRVKQDTAKAQAKRKKKSRTSSKQRASK